MSSEKFEKLIGSPHVGEALFIIGMTILAVSLGVIVLQLAINFHWVVE